MIKPIETHYAGHRFRSRLEARWAVFFDHMKIQWRYEPQGFKVTSMLAADVPERYYLPDFYLPGTETWVEVKGDPGKLDFQLLGDLTDWGGALPGMENSVGTTRGLLLLGDIPGKRDDGYIPALPILQHRKCGWVRLATFKTGGFCVEESGESEYYFDTTCDYMEPSDPWAQVVLKYFSGDWGLPGEKGDSGVARALDAARQARFEHGEAPRRVR